MIQLTLEILLALGLLAFGALILMLIVAALTRWRGDLEMRRALRWWNTLTPSEKVQWDIDVGPVDWRHMTSETRELWGELGWQKEPSEKVALATILHAWNVHRDRQ